MLLHRARQNPHSGIDEVFRPNCTSPPSPPLLSPTPYPLLIWVVAAAILRSGLIPPRCTLSSLIDVDLDALDPEGGGERGFLEFVRGMIRWEPGERKSAGEVAEMGWLDVREEDEGEEDDVE